MFLVLGRPCSLHFHCMDDSRVKYIDCWLDRGRSECELAGDCKEGTGLEKSNRDKSLFCWKTKL